MHVCPREPPVWVHQCGCCGGGQRRLLFFRSSTLFYESESFIGLQLINLPTGQQAPGVFFCPYLSSPGVTTCTTIPGFFMWIWGLTHVLRPMGQVITLLAELSLKLK